MLLAGATEAEGKAAEGEIPFYVDFGFVRRHVTDQDAGTKGLVGKQLSMGKVAKGDLVLSGYASTWVMDRDLEYVSPKAFDRTLNNYLTKNPINLWQHDKVRPIGQTLTATVDKGGLAIDSWIRQVKSDEERWRVSAFRDMESGIVKTFSIGGFFDREVVEGEVLISNVDLFEISVVSIPSNPDSLFEAAAKAAKGMPVHSDAHERVQQQMMQLLGMVPVTDPQLVRLDGMDQRAHYHELARVFAKATGKQAPLFTDWRDLTDALEKGGSHEEALRGTRQILDTLNAPQVEEASLVDPTRAKWREDDHPRDLFGRFADAVGLPRAPEGTHPDPAPRYTAGVPDGFTRLHQNPVEFPTGVHVDVARKQHTIRGDEYQVKVGDGNWEPFQHFIEHTDPKTLVGDQNARFNHDFWKGVQPEDVMYARTSKDGREFDLEGNLKPGVTMHPHPDYVATHGPESLASGPVVKIDLNVLASEPRPPDVTPPPEIANANAREAIAHQLGVPYNGPTAFAGGVDPHGLIVGNTIPSKAITPAPQHGTSFPGAPEPTAIEGFPPNEPAIISIPRRKRGQRDVEGEEKDFVESQHPRDPVGRFTHLPGSGAGDIVSAGQGQSEYEFGAELPKGYKHDRTVNIGGVEIAHATLDQSNEGPLRRIFENQFQGKPKGLVKVGGEKSDNHWVEFDAWMENVDVSQLKDKDKTFSQDLWGGVGDWKTRDGKGNGPAVFVSPDAVDEHGVIRKGTTLHADPFIAQRDHYFGTGGDQKALRIDLAKMFEAGYTPDAHSPLAEADTRESIADDLHENWRDGSFIGSSEDPNKVTFDGDIGPEFYAIDDTIWTRYTTPWGLPNPKDAPDTMVAAHVTDPPLLQICRRNRKNNLSKAISSKAGRVLSAANETRLREAMATINEVLALVEKPDDAEQEPQGSPDEPRTSLLPA